MDCHYFKRENPIRRGFWIKLHNPFSTGKRIMRGVFTSAQWTSSEISLRLRHLFHPAPSLTASNVRVASAPATSFGPHYGLGYSCDDFYVSKWGWEGGNDLSKATDRVSGLGVEPGRFSNGDLKFWRFPMVIIVLRKFPGNGKTLINIVIKHLPSKS